MDYFVYSLKIPFCNIINIMLNYKSEMNNIVLYLKHDKPILDFVRPL